MKSPAELLRLSPRQGEIMALVHQDLQDKEIADRLKCSRFTVRSHLVLIFQKLAVKTRAGAAVEWERASHKCASASVRLPRKQKTK